MGLARWVEVEGHFTLVKALCRSGISAGRTDRVFEIRLGAGAHPTGYESSVIGNGNFTGLNLLGRGVCNRLWIKTPEIFVKYVQGENNYYYSVEVTGGADTVPEGAFCNCTRLTSVTLQNSLRAIGARAFYGCSRLSSLVLPNSLHTIGESAFDTCSELTSLVMPESLRHVGRYAFYKCSRLASVKFPSSLRTIGEGAFSDCKRLKLVELPNSLEHIEPCVFNRYSNLASVVFPVTLNVIGRYAFSRCTSLTSRIFQTR